MPSADLGPMSLPGPGASFGYGINEAFYPNDDSFDPIAVVTSVNISKVTDPSDTILAGDSAAYVNFGKPILGTQYYLYVPSRQGTPLNPFGVGFPSVHALHIDHANILYFDGHVHAERITPPTQPDILGAPPSAYASHNIGYVIKPGCAMGDTTCEDYYYQLAK